MKTVVVRVKKTMMYKNVRDLETNVEKKEEKKFFDQ